MELSRTLAYYLYEALGSILSIAKKKKNYTQPIQIKYMCTEHIYAYTSTCPVACAFGEVGGEEDLLGILPLRC
jgi:hypothetical protein